MSWRIPGMRPWLLNHRNRPLRIPGKAIKTNCVAYGSYVTIKNYRTGGGYLHSHWHLYPDGVGAQQQQVTTYSHKDENNLWQVKKADTELDPDTVQIVNNRAKIRLQHVSTGRNLHSHNERAPITRRHHQITGYGVNGSGDINDVYELVLDSAAEGTHLNTLRSPFRLVHNVLGCALHSHSKQLPKWGWEQMEVTCNPIVRDKKNLWIIEEVTDKRLPNNSFALYTPSYVESFLELHAVMFQGNSGLKPKEGEITSRPWQWPINYRGQPFSGGDHKVYLLGNPVLWWLNLALMAVFVIIYLVYSVARQRGLNVDKYMLSYCSSCVYGCSWLFGAWLLHYVPFWFMGRILYFHHYFPAHLYSCMISGIMLDYICHRGSQWLWPAVSYAFNTALLAVFIYSFIEFCPLCYGSLPEDDGENATSSLQHLKWLDSWDF